MDVGSRESSKLTTGKYIKVEDGDPEHFLCGEAIQVPSPYHSAGRRPQIMGAANTPRLRALQRRACSSLAGGA